MSSGSAIASVEAAERKRQEAMRCADISALERLLHDDLIYVHSSGRFENKPDHLAAISGARVVYHDFALCDVVLEMVNDGAVLSRGHVAINLTFDRQPKVLNIAFMSIWALGRDQQWQLRTWQSTPIAVDLSAIQLR